MLIRVQRFCRAVFFAGLVFAGSVAAVAQTDIAVSLFGAFTGTTTSDGIHLTPADQAGGMAELRHIVNPLVGYDATYSYYRANQTLPPLVTCFYFPGCNFPNLGISANAHEITGDWIVSRTMLHVMPFALAGGGVLITVPASGQTGLTSATKAVFVYGAGLDWGLLSHIGLRVQYRGNIYKTPELVSGIQSTSFLHTAEPMIGAYFRF